MDQVTEDENLTIYRRARHEETLAMMAAVSTWGSKLSNPQPVGQRHRAGSGKVRAKKPKTFGKNKRSKR